MSNPRNPLSPCGRPVAAVSLSDEEKSHPLSIVRSRSPPHAVVQRAQIVLACAQGESNTTLAKRVGLSHITVGKWHRRFKSLANQDELAAHPRFHVVEAVQRDAEGTGDFRYQR